MTQTPGDIWVAMMFVFFIGFVLGLVAGECLRASGEGGDDE